MQRSITLPTLPILPTLTLSIIVCPIVKVAQKVLHLQALLLICIRGHWSILYHLLVLTQLAFRCQCLTIRTVLKLKVVLWNEAKVVRAHIFEGTDPTRNIVEAADNLTFGDP